MGGSAIGCGFSRWLCAFRKSHPEGMVSGISSPEAARLALFLPRFRPEFAHIPGHADPLTRQVTFRVGQFRRPWFPGSIDGTFPPVMYQVPTQFPFSQECPDRNGAVHGAFFSDFSGSARPLPPRPGKRADAGDQGDPARRTCGQRPGDRWHDSQVMDDPAVPGIRARGGPERLARLTRARPTCSAARLLPPQRCSPEARRCPWSGCPATSAPSERHRCRASSRR